ncbi:hypothetical protein TSUD_130120 [Trifolium subterraneum]|nr:hypothetical protein TSUD_130120 [Trifolium subterraneum]
MILTGFIRDTYAASRLINFSTHSNYIPFDYSLKIFNHLHNPNTFIWNTIMRSPLELQNSPHQALNFYKLFLFQNTSPDHYTYPILLRSCTARVSEPEGKQIHDHVIKVGFDSDVYVTNTLINLYAVCGNMVSARQVFEESLVLDLVSWNTLLAGYVNLGDVMEAERVYDRMPERSTIASNSMIVLFGRKGCIVKARRLFDRIGGEDMVSWSAMISCYEQNGMCEEALVLFVDMNANAVMVDEVVVVSAISACTSLSAVRMGRSVHGLTEKVGIQDYVSLQNALIHLYSSCGEILDAQKLFNGDEVAAKLKIEGYAPVTSEVSLDIDEEEKETALFSHSEKLAVAFGLITIPPPAPIRIIKNLRIWIVIVFITLSTVLAPAWNFGSKIV